MRRAAAWSTNYFPGEMNLLNRSRTMRRAGRPDQNRLGARKQTVTAFATLAQMFTNGARIGLTQIITKYRRSEIPEGRCAQWAARPLEQNLPRLVGAHREAGPGVISRKCRDAPRALAFLQNFSMPIMDFELPAMFATNERASRPRQYFTTQKTCYGYGCRSALLYKHMAKGEAVA